MTNTTTNTKAISFEKPGHMTSIISNMESRTKRVEGKSVLTGHDQQKCPEGLPTMRS